MKPREILKGKIIDLTELSDFRKMTKKKGKTIVYTAGNWDMVHVGQMRYLHEAKKLGDYLVVGVQSNEAVKKVKGPMKPILDEWMRAETLAFLSSVDFVTINPMTSSKPSIELLRPDVYVTVGEEWNKDYESSIEYKTVTSYGGKVELIDRQSPIVSTSRVIQRIISGTLTDLLKDYSNTQSDGPLKERFK